MKSRTILIDYFFAGVYQLLNVASPFIIIYFFLPIIGKTYFSNIILITAIGSYFKLIYEFGFDYFTAKRVSKDSTIRTKQIVFSGVFSAKIILALLFFIPQLLITALLIEIKEFYFIVVYSLSTIFFSLVPNWYFLALRKFKLMALLNIICHVGILLSSFLLITNQNLWYHYASAMALGYILQLTISLNFISKELVSFDSILNFNLAKKYLIYSLSIMKFNILSNIYVSSSVIMLRIFKTPPELITDFGIAEKLVRAIRQVINPINRVAYPILIKFYKISKRIYKNSLAQVSIIIFMIGGLLSYIVYKNSRLIYQSINYQVHEDIIILTNILLPILTIGSVGGFLCVNKFIATNKEKQLVNIMLITSSFFLIVSPVLIFERSIVGAAMAVILSEALLLLLTIFKK